MLEGHFSRTAISAAGMRAAHQILDAGRIFSDPLATQVLGEDLQAHLARDAEPGARRLRLFIALRSRVAEDAAKQAIAEGARQIVVLGAGLDTFGCRVTPVEGLRVFEVDHPATQAEKRRRLAEAGIAAPDCLIFAPCDFERQALADALGAAGFEESARAVFFWLGVTPYLTPQTVESTLRYVGGLAGGAEIIFDYVNPPSSLDSAARREFHERLASRVAQLGETFRSDFATPDLHRLLHSLGFEGIEDLGPRQIAERLAPGSSPTSENGGHIVRASFNRR